MYWWRISPLKLELASGTISESEKLKYLVAMILLYSISSEGGYLVAQADPEDALTATDWLSSALFVILTFAGTYYCYRRNQSGDAKDFIERFVCISWPITMRFVAIMVLFFAALFGFGSMLSERFESWVFQEGLLTVATLVVFEVVFYWYLAKHIYEIATRNA